MTQAFLSTALAAALTALLPSIGSAQPIPERPDNPTSDFRIQVWGNNTSADFSAQVTRYFDLRGRLADRLPPVTVTDDPSEIRRRQRSLARAIRLARLGAVQGEFFTVAAAAEFKVVLSVIMNAKVWAMIMDDNPGALRHDIDGAYPDGATRSTMPGVVLARLPRLPDGVEYRFLGRHLILHDVRANTIIDRLPYAIDCADCDD